MPPRGPKCSNTLTTRGGVQMRFIVINFIPKKNPCLKTNHPKKIPTFIPTKSPSLRSFQSKSLKLYISVHVPPIQSLTIHIQRNCPRRKTVFFKTILPMSYKSVLKDKLTAWAASCNHLNTVCMLQCTCKHCFR